MIADPSAELEDTLARILTIVRVNPGANASTIGRILGCTSHEVAAYLQLLDQMGLVRSVPE